MNTQPVSFEGTKMSLCRLSLWILVVSSVPSLAAAEQPRDNDEDGE